MLCCACWLLLVLCGYSAASLVTLSNIKQRTDVRGVPMDIHDGTILHLISSDGLYYFYGIGYGDCHADLNFGCAGVLGLGDCGFRLNHSVNLYTSPDLVSWSFVRDILPVDARPEGIYFRPKVVYNDLSKKFVLWVNKVNRSTPWVHNPNFLDATYVVATSDTPDGVFSVINPNIQSVQYGAGGDLALFVDDDGKGYIAYDAFTDSHRIQVEQLAPDYLSSLGAAATSGPITPTNNEAPIMFKRNGFYYLLFGKCCCFCRPGSNAQVYTATAPLGPWTDSGIDIDPMTVVNGTKRSVSGGQNSFVFTAFVVDRAQKPLRFAASSAPTLIFVSDRWGTGPVMALDMQYWQPLAFNDSAQPPSISPLRWVDEFTLDLES